MNESIEVTDAELTLILEALEDAVFFRDARSRVLDSAARRSSRRFPARGEQQGGAADADRRKVREYTELAARLRSPSSGGSDGPPAA